MAVGVAEFGDPFRHGAAFAGDPLNRREVIIEATYRAPVSAWLNLQPDLQFLINPGGQLATANALIVGLRGEVGF
jgi:porin